MIPNPMNALSGDHVIPYAYSHLQSIKWVDKFIQFINFKKPIINISKKKVIESNLINLLPTKSWPSLT